MKKCLYCAEEIQDAAVVCRHCGKDLNQAPAPAQIDESKVDLPGVAKLIALLFLIGFCIIWWYIFPPLIILWFLWKKTSFTTQKKAIASIAIVSVFAITYGALAYHDRIYNRAPQLVITDPASDNTSVQAASYMVKGKVIPAYSEITTSGQNLTKDSSGDFTITVPLDNETNQVGISVVNGKKQVDKTITIKRIFTDEEKAAQAEQKATQQTNEKYMADVTNINNVIKDSMQKMSSILEDYSSPLLWTQQDITLIAGFSVVVEESNKQARLLTPPDKYKSVHAEWLQGLQELSDAMPLFRKGLDSHNSNLIDKAAKKVLEGSMLFNKANNDFSKV